MCLLPLCNISKNSPPPLLLLHPPLFYFYCISRFYLQIYLPRSRHIGHPVILKFYFVIFVIILCQLPGCSCLTPPPFFEVAKKNRVSVKMSNRKTRCGGNSKQPTQKTCSLKIPNSQHKKKEAGQNSKQTMQNSPIRFRSNFRGAVPKPGPRTPRAPRLWSATRSCWRPDTCRPRLTTEHQSGIQQGRILGREKNNAQKKLNAESFEPFYAFPHILPMRKLGRGCFGVSRHKRIPRAKGGVQGS